jgi:hypothetical protein
MPTISRLQQAVVLLLGNPVDQAEHGRFDKFDQPLEHLRLAGEMAVQRRLGELQLARQRSGGNPVALGLFQHFGQCLQYLHAALAWRCACHVISQWWWSNR